jgi:hypothetical protein
MSLNILGRAVKAHRNREPVLTKKMEDGRGNQGAVGGQGIMRFFAEVPVPGLGQGHDFLNQSEGQERLAPGEMEMVFLVQKRQKKKQEGAGPGGIPGRPGSASYSNRRNGNCNLH